MPFSLHCIITLKINNIVLMVAVAMVAVVKAVVVVAVIAVTVVMVAVMVAVVKAMAMVMVIEMVMHTSGIRLNLLTLKSFLPTTTSLSFTIICNL